MPFCLDDFRTLLDRRLDGFFETESFEICDGGIDRREAHGLPQLGFPRIEESPQLIFFIANGLFGYQDLLHPGRDGGLGLEHIDDGHHAGVGLDAVGGQ